MSTAIPAMLPETTTSYAVDGCNCAVLAFLEVMVAIMASVGRLCSYEYTQPIADGPLWRTRTLPDCFDFFL